MIPSLEEQKRIKAELRKAAQEKRLMGQRKNEKGRRMSSLFGGKEKAGRRSSSIFGSLLAGRESASKKIIPQDKIDMDEERDKFLKSLQDRS